MANALYKTLLESISDPSIDDETSIFIIDNILGNEKLGIKPMLFETAAGLKPLTFFETFDKTKFEMAVLNSKVEHEQKIRLTNLQNLDNKMFTAAVEFRSGNINRVDLQATYNEVLSDPYFMLNSPEGQKIISYYEDALEHTGIKFLNDKESRKELKKLHKQYSGGIPISKLTEAFVHPNIIKEGLDQGIVLPYGTSHWLDENKDIDSTRVNTIKDTYLNILTKGRTSDKNFTLHQKNYELAATNLSEDVFRERIDFYLSDQEWVSRQTYTTENELYGIAHDTAYGEIMVEIDKVTNTNENVRKESWLYEKGFGASSTSKQGTLSFDKPEMWSLSNGLDIGAADTSAKRNEFIKNHLNDSENPGRVLSGTILSSMLGNEDLGVTVENLPILLGGTKEQYENIPSWAIFASREDANGISALQIWNAERKAHGLEEVRVDQLPLSLQPAAKVIGFLPKPDLITVQNGHVDIVIDKSGLISTEYLYNAWRSYDDLEVPAETVLTLSNELGIDYNLIYSPTGELLESGIPLLEKIERHYFNDMLAKATEGVDDKNQALQNFWSLANGNPREDWKTSFTAEENGLDFINRYHANGGELAGYDISYDLLSDTELSVDTLKEDYMGENIKVSLLKGVSDENLIQARANIKTKELDEQKYKEFVVENNDWESYYNYKTNGMKAVSLESIDAEIAALEATKDEISFATRSTQKYYVDPRAYDYVRKMDQLLKQRNIVSLMQGGVGDTDWGLRAAMEDDSLTKTWLSRLFVVGAVTGIPNWTKDFRVISDIESVIGQTELTALKKLAAKNAGLSTVPDSLTASLVVPNIKKEMEDAYITEFYKLLLMHPKFFTGDTYGVE
jgi:hypothetical protein